MSEKKDVSNEYDQLKDKRQDTLKQQFQEYLLRLKYTLTVRNIETCKKTSWRDGEFDEIDEKVCLKRKEKEMNYTMLRILPQLTQHAVNYEQCLEECQKNKIAYLIANQSCREAYEKNFKKAILRITQTILGGLT